VLQARREPVTLKRKRRIEKAMEKEQCLAQAIRMEREGKAFYLRAAEKAENGSVKAILAGLAKEEDSHIDKIEQIHDQLRKGQPLRQWITCIAQRDPADIFAGMAQGMHGANDLNTLDVALHIEEKSITYYQDLADKAQDRYEKRFYLALAQEEWGHYLKIMDSIQYLSDPVGWHYVHERDMEDAG
jgi:rubrerythrin